jgi:Uma2 family endonuclease
MTTTSTTPITAEALFQMGDIGRCELVRGEIVKMAPAGFDHGNIESRIDRQVGGFVTAHDLGVVVTGETGFILSRNPDTVRAADVAFLRKQRVPAEGSPGFFDGPPDLAIEVISPSDRMSDVHAKIEEWLAAGTQSVWAVDPPNRWIDVYQGDGKVVRYRAADTLRDERFLPGFTMQLAEVFRS